MTAFVRYAPVNGIVVISTAIGALAPVEEPSTASTEHCRVTLTEKEVAGLEGSHAATSSPFWVKIHRRADVIRHVCGGEGVRHTAVHPYPSAFRWSFVSSHMCALFVRIDPE